MTPSERCAFTSPVKGGGERKKSPPPERYALILPPQGGGEKKGRLSPMTGEESREHREVEGGETTPAKCSKVN
jgi:hypothetical protein